MNVSSMDSKKGINAVLFAGFGATILAGLFVLSRYNFLLFHGVTELFSIAVAWSVFLLVWSTRRISSNDALLFIGVAYGFIGLIDLVHTLAYEGMGAFDAGEAYNHSTQLWIAARGLEAASMLVFPFLLGCRFRVSYAVAGFAVLTGFFSISIFTMGTFPDCYIEGQGLTPFKKGAEYAICLVLVLAMALLSGRREHLDTDVFRLMLAAMAVTVAAELAFTFYISVYGVSNMAGHLFKIVSFFFVYLALVRSTVTRPQATVFRELGREKEKLAEERQEFELLHRISSSFMRFGTLEKTLSEVPDLIAKHYRVPIVAVELYDVKRGEMVFAGSTGIADADGGTLRVPVEQAISGTVVRTGQSVIELDVSDNDNYRDRVLRALNVVTFVCFPMVTRQGIIGTLAVADRNARPDLADSPDLLQALAGSLAQEIERNQREDAYRLLVENARAGFILLDAEGRCVTLNRYMSEALGGRPADFIGKSLREVLPLETDLHLGRLARIIEEKQGAQYEDAFQLPAGTRWFSSDLQPVIGSSGDVTGFQIVTVDITERKLVESERESTLRMLEILNAKTGLHKLMQTLLRFMQEMSGCEAVAIRLRDGHDFPYYETSGFSDDFVAAERHLCVENLDGQMLCDEVGNPILECMCGNIICGRFDPVLPFFTDFGSFVSNGTSKLLASTTEEDRQARTRNRCNAEGYESVLLVPLRTGGETFGLLQFNDRREGCFSPQFVDQVERLAGNVAIALAQRKAEEALRESESKFRDILNNSRDLLYKFNIKKGIYDYLSPSLEDLVGISVEDYIKGGIDLAVSFVHPEDTNRLQNHIDHLLKQTIEEDIAPTIEYRFKHPIKGYRWISDNRKVIYDANDSAIAVVGNSRDITDSKQIEEALEKRMVALTRPLDDPEGVGFEELFNIDDIQQLQDQFAEATGVASIITRIDGTPITRSSNFCRLCKDIIRQTDKGLSNCFKSDAMLGRHNPEGPAIQPCLSGGLWDAGAGISIGGKHVANWLIGQVRDKTQTDENMRAYAREIGADEEAVIEAFHEVPGMSREQFGTVAQALFTLANQLSSMAYQNIQQARFISEKKRAEEDLQQSEDTHRNMLNNLNTGVVVHAPDTSILFANTAACNLLGLSEDQMLAKKAFDPQFKLFRDDGSQMPLDEYPVNRVLTTNEPLRNLIVGLKRPQMPDMVWFLVNGFVRTHEAGQVEQVIINFVDITERKEAEAATRNSEDNFRLMTDSMQETLSVIALDGIFLYSNKNAAHSMSGGKFDNVTGKNIRELLPEDQAEHLIGQYRGVYHSGEPMHQEIEVSLPNGKTWFSNTLKPIEYGNPARSAILSVSLDITESKRLEERFLQAHKMEAIGSLAGGIAHDFNNILFPIVGLSEMLLEDLPSGSIEHENAQEINNAGKRGADLVMQILTFSRQSEQKKIPIRIQQILKEVLKLTRATIPADIEILLDIQPDCGPVIADPTQIHQIAMNLITNAYHAVETAGGSISIKLTEDEYDGGNLPIPSLAPGQYALFSVSDTGSGIDPAVLDKIFEPYFTTKEMGKGTGLGLSMVYGIVTEHGGDIKVDSQMGKGATFNIYLPVIAKDAGQAFSQAAAADITGTERILLVDDEQTVVRLEKQMLERLGYHVAAWTSSFDALRAFKANPFAFDLVISDMAMPNITGDKLARELIAIRPDIPIIICTGFSERINQERALAIGIKGFLMKPIVKSDMARMIRKALDGVKGPARP